MVNHAFRYRLLWAAVLLSLACTSKPQEKKNPLAGSVKVGLLSKGTQASAGTTAPDICATFTLTPYALSAAGAQTLAGSAVVVQPSGPSATPILGCVHTPGVSPDWRYVVTASNFTGCSATINGISPAVETFTVDVSCDPGKDVSAAVTANVSVPVANAGGYIDIGVSVNSTEVQIGCKQADVKGGLLHFGQSSIQPTGSPIPAAYTGIGIYPSSVATTGAAPAAGTVQQFESSVHDGSSTDVSFTGMLAIPAYMGATLVQAFTQPCPTGQMNVQPGAAECITTVTPGFVPDGQPPRWDATTHAQIADVFQQWPGRGAVSASINGAQTIQLYTSLAGPHLSTLTPPVLGNDALTHTQTLSVAPANAIGLYGSLVHSDELLAIVQDPTLGAALVILTLDETTGAWSAAAPISLSSFTTAQQQQIGLFGTGGCFPEPALACTQANAGNTPVALPRIAPAPSALTSSGTITVSLTHADGTAVDTSHPLRASDSEFMTVNLQWSVAGLPVGGKAYPVVGLCNPYIGLINSIGGQGVGPGCLNGYQQPQTHDSFAFPALAESSGGVTQDLQFKVYTASYFVDDATWTLPFSLYVQTGTSPDPTVDVLVKSATAVAPLYSAYVAKTNAVITKAMQVSNGGPGGNQPGLQFTIRYQPGTTNFATAPNPPFVGHYLTGNSVTRFLPPSITNGLNAWLVPGSFADLHEVNNDYPIVEASKSINSNIVTSVAPDALHGGIPTVSVDNLIGFYNSAHTLAFTADWFVPTPTQDGTILYTQAVTSWNGQTFSDVGVSPYAGTNSLDISPVPVAQLFPIAYHSCGDDFYGPLYQGGGRGMAFQAEYNSGHLLADGTAVANPTATPQYPNVGVPFYCIKMFNYVGEYYFTADRGVEGGNGGFNAHATTLINPTYVVKLSPDEYLSTSYLNAGLGGSVSISTSDSPGCDNTNFDGSNPSVPWTPTINPAGPADFSQVRCLAYQFTGVLTSPQLNNAFLTKLQPAITAAPAVGEHRFTTHFFWATAANVLPTPGDASNNTWAVKWMVNSWQNISLLDFATTVHHDPAPVDVVLTNEWYGHDYGLPVPDLTVLFRLALGAQYDTTTAPETWIGPPKDEDGVPAAVTCAISGRDLTCTMKSVTPGRLIPGPGGNQNNGHNNLALGVPHYKFIASETYNGEYKVHSAWMSSSAPWLQSPVQAGNLTDRVIAPNSLNIAKTVLGAVIRNAGAPVVFNITFGAAGVNSGQIGAGGVSIYDFFGKDFVAGSNGAAGTLEAQAQGCVKPVPLSVKLNDAVLAPNLYYTTDTSPGTTASTTWVAVPADGSLPPTATGVKIVPVSSFGQDGVLLPVDGPKSVQVTMSGPAGVTGKLCNSAALTADMFNATATPEAVVTLVSPCVDPFPWPAAAAKK